MVQSINTKIGDQRGSKNTEWGDAVKGGLS